jgi:6-phosphogluconolactonase
MPRGSGPRHFVFNPAGDVVYAVNELDSTVASLSFDPVEGNLAVVATAPTIPGVRSTNHCSEIQLSRDGRLLLVGNRGDDSLSMFRVGKTGQLSAPERVPCGGRTPRHFAFDPSGKFVAVANQDSDRISIFAIDERQGLQPICDVSEGTPTCLCFAP